MFKATMQLLPKVAPAFKGVDFDFGNDRVYTIPPLTIVDLRRLKREIATLQKVADIDPVEGVDACVALVHAALLRNYPDMTLEKVAGFLDLSNMVDVIKCVMNFNGALGNRMQALDHLGEK